MSVRNNPFARNASPSPSPGPNLGPGRPKSTLFAPAPSPLAPSPMAAPSPPSHSRSHSHASPSSGPSGPAQPQPLRSSHQRELSRSATTSTISSTFAPSFIKTEDMRKHSDMVKGIEGENDFSGKKYVWLKDPQAAFVKGWVVEELGENRILVQCDDGSVSGSDLPGTRESEVLTRRAATRCRRRERGQGQSGQIRQGERHG